MLIPWRVLMMFIPTILLAMILSTGLATHAASRFATLSEPTIPNIDDLWQEDVAQGLQQAQREKKDILMLFTGSDWCPPCMKLDKEILTQPSFLQEVEPRFVLVKLDFPRNSPQAEALAEQNKTWAKEFGVDSFPTLFMLDQQGRPYAIAGYESGGVDNYLAMLETSRQLRIQRDEKLQLAADQQGLDRAKTLDEAISLLREDLVEIYYPEVVAEIVELDAENQLGLKSKWNSVDEAEMRRAIFSDILLISRLEKPTKALEFITAVLNDIDFPIREKMSIFNIQLNLLRELGDTQATSQLLDIMIGLDGVTTETRARLVVKKINLYFGAQQVDNAWALLDQSLGQDPGSLYLLKAKGDLLDATGKFDQAIAAYQAAINVAKNEPDLMIELVSAKADVEFNKGDEATALATLDRFVDDSKLPADLRAQALLHKSLIMRESKRIRQARLAENRAIELSQSPQSRRELQTVVDKIRAKFGED